MAIDTLGEQLQGIHAEQLNPAELTAALEAAVWAANDRISQRNDNEQRLDRQRMGTTLVMSLVRGHELYTTHVGDSRAYRITRWGCRQVTLDDDIASREVRLGYSAYREALQNPGSGSLIQALGMGASHSLHPTVQRFVLDEDCVFLLCSDGLSDSDRVHEIWDSEILPLLNGGNLSRVCDRLVELANTRNGHDNVTVAVLHCQVSDRAAVPPLSLPALSQAIPESPTATVSGAPKIAPAAAAAVAATFVYTHQIQIAKSLEKQKPLIVIIMLSKTSQVFFHHLYCLVLCSY
ncbi:MAG: serine/threonine-protein phosphatase [Leptolyngbyaceae cyanobacterium SM1_3_5]|nr:serine/threonine-protein phosphatase [Leptolyngbyaceae cyanobacterium SM1_3_5]